MKLTSKGRYAVNAMLDLVAHSNGKPVIIIDISDRQMISKSYLEQLFKRLRDNGIVRSVRGPGGGYLLAQHPDNITIKDILNAVGENINLTKDMEDIKAFNSPEFDRTKEYFTDLGNVVHNCLLTSIGSLNKNNKK